MEDLFLRIPQADDAGICPQQGDGFLRDAREDRLQIIVGDDELRDSIQSLDFDQASLDLIQGRGKGHIPGRGSTKNAQGLARRESGACQGLSSSRENVERACSPPDNG